MQRRVRSVIDLLLPPWLRDYQPGWLRGDVLAGLTAAAVVIPTALAYATFAGLPVQVGLYTAMVPMALYTLLGTSRPLSLSTTATLAILTNAALAPTVAAGDPALLAGATAALSFTVGGILVLAGLLRLGFIADFLSAPVLIGYQAGMGVVIVLDQLPKLLGFHIEKGSFAHNVAATAAALPDTSLPTALCSIVMVMTLLAIKRFTPRIPAPLVVVVIGIAGMGLFGLHRYGIVTVGSVSIGLPPVTLPEWTLLVELWPAAMGIALMSFTSSIAAGQAFVDSDEPPPRANRELLALGVANLGGALFAAMPAGAGTTQTAINRTAGAHTQLCQLVTFSAAIAIALLLAPYISLLPNATLASVVFVYSMTLIKPAEFRDILTVRKTEFLWAIVAMVGVILLGTLQGIIVAIVVSLVALAYQVADPPVHVMVRMSGSNIFRPKAEQNADDESVPGLLLLRPEGRLFFANAERVSQKMRLIIFDVMPDVVALDLGGVFDVEYTALKMLMAAEQRLHEKGITLWLVGLTPGVHSAVMQSRLGKTLSAERLFLSLELAVDHFQKIYPARAPQLPPL